MKIDLLGGTGQAESVAVADQLTQNWYVHIDPEGKSQISLYPTPGLSAFAVTALGPIRGAIEYNNLLYVVSADTLWEITSAGATTNRGTLLTSTGRITMAHNGPANGTQIAIADGTHFYIWDSSGTPDFKVITNAADPDYDADCPIPTFVDIMDGYFIINDTSTTGRFYISSSYDGTAWDALDYATAERSSDDLQAIKVSNRVLWLIGTDSAEAWFNSGATFPFEPIQSGFSEWGTPAPHSVVEMAGSIFYLAQNQEGTGQVVMTSGLTPQVISTQAITSEISKLTTLSDAYGYVYQHGGHNFYVLSFPTDGHTFVYDLTTQKWHKWNSYATNGQHRSTCHVYIFGKHLVGDSESGRVFELDWDVYTDFGDTITRIRRSKSIHAEDIAIRHYSMWVDMEEGTGDYTTTDPQIMMRFRDDAGLWSNEKWRSIGALGKYRTRIVWRRLGRSRDRVYEIKITDPVKAVVLGAYIDVQGDREPIR